LTSQDAIRELFLRYAQAIDCRDFDRAASIFSADCFVHGTFASGPLSDYWPKIRERVEEYGRTMHLVGNILIDESGEDGTAQTDTYCIAYHLEPIEGDSPWVVAVRYTDRLAETEDGWKVIDRSVQLVWERDAL
jgi:3-phenylpropionate/cinnamic acid dioxygenase small subunit